MSERTGGAGVEKPAAVWYDGAYLTAGLSG